jgi:hypothetical protein
MNVFGGVIALIATIGLCVVFPPFTLVVLLIIGFAMMDR